MCDVEKGTRTEQKGYVRCKCGHVLAAVLRIEGRDPDIQGLRAYKWDMPGQELREGYTGVFVVGKCRHCRATHRVLMDGSTPFQLAFTDRQKMHTLSPLFIYGSAHYNNYTSYLAKPRARRKEPEPVA